ncbi:hypothetical protein DL96DRAFT_1813293 [Flagelloscypha sp. PMI_526]|nr:hypothetical protein DL96DRAFT_1813293 [Flagelloscypha sp. PMI_526]
MNTPGNLPAELWLRVAAYLSDEQLPKLATLNYSLLNAAREALYSESFFPMHLEGWFSHPNNPRRPQSTPQRQAILREMIQLLTRIQAYCDYPHLAHRVKIIRFGPGSSNIQPRSKRRGWSIPCDDGDQLSARLFRRLSHTVEDRLLEAISCLPCVDSMVIDLPGVDVTRFRVSFMQSAWASFAPNLVHLSITPGTISTFGRFLPPEFLYPLHNLQTMKLVLPPFYSHSIPSEEHATLRSFVMLYSNLNLNRLEIIGGYGAGLVLDEVLPPGHHFPRLHTFILNIGDVRHDWDINTLPWFLDLHQPSLRVLEIYPVELRIPFDEVRTKDLESLRVRFNGSAEAFNLKHPPLPRPFFGSSIRTLEISARAGQFFSTAIDLLRPHEFASAANLRDLTISYRYWSIAQFADLAVALPNLSSLKLEINIFEMPTGSLLQMKTTRKNFTIPWEQTLERCGETTKDHLLTLRQWGLYDLTITVTPTWYWNHSSKWNYQFMLGMAELIPSVRSFYGSGSLDEPKHYQKSSSL